MSNGIGAKFDGGKLMFSLLTRGLALPLKSIVAVLTYGAAKYSADSWKEVPDAKRRYEDAMDRHLNAWKSGETHDSESGLHHLAHAACNMLFVIYFEMNRSIQLGERQDNWFKPNDPYLHQDVVIPMLQFGHVPLKGNYRIDRND